MRWQALVFCGGKQSDIEMLNFILYQGEGAMETFWIKEIDFFYIYIFVLSFWKFNLLQDLRPCTL